MSTNEYTNITIIDCNRQHSIQAKSGNDENPALFTNELGRGIKLKVGDKVSVQGAYISEIGAGANTIELKGEKTGKQRTINYTKETYRYPAVVDDEYSDATKALPLITGYQQVEFEPNASLTYDIVDNETYITIEFYINNSGDSGYVSLPRRYATNASEETSTTPWTSKDKLDQGRPYQELLNNQFVSDDYFYYDNSETGEPTGFYKLRNDCSRFTLMKREGTTYLRRQRVADTGRNWYSNPDPPTLDRLLEAKYYTYKQPIKISIQKGFNTPDNISQDINRILKEANDPVDFNIINQGVIKPVTQYVSSQTFRPELCASNEAFNDIQYKRFTYWRNSASGGSVEDREEGSHLYYSCFYNVYHKRPEIREAGQVLNNYLGSGIKVNEIIYTGDRRTSTVKTNILFEENELSKLRNLFKAQKLYPELFSNINAQNINKPFQIGDPVMSVDNARYIHMNTQGTATRTTRLGGDNIDFNASTTNQQSCPLFFYFQKENEDKFTNGHNINDLCYGFATKYESGGQYYVELHPELINGINQELFKNAVGTIVNIQPDTLLGYDYSFNAYGTACLIGYSGRLELDYPQINQWGLGDINIYTQEDPHGEAENLKTAKYMRYNYIGSNNPKFEYDADDNRFYFSDLHTPEVNGQSWISAGDNGSAVSPAIEDNTQEGNNIVYKINKRINPYTYTPDMKPYVYEYDPKIKYTYGHSGSGSGETERDISQPNRNIYPWSIFDSQSGIFISDFGYDEKEWTNGLWGILGFTYNQFNQTLDSTNNRQSRIINSNINNLNIPTTNSDIVSTDTRNFVVNQFGAVYFTTQLPSTSTLKNREFVPAITQNTESIKLYANNLPRKMLRPYYCIRSDIIDAPHYIGGATSNNQLGVVAIADKQYSGNDFIFSSEEDYTFTITKEKTITNITTSIHDPNQSFSRVNLDSAVIYKIQSQVVNDTSIAEELLAELKKRN